MIKVLENLNFTCACTMMGHDLETRPKMSIKTDLRVQTGMFVKQT